MNNINCRVWEQLKRRSSFQVLPTVDNQRKTNGATRELNHPAFQNIRICLVRILIARTWVKKSSYNCHIIVNILQTENANGVQQPMTVVTLSKLITPQAMQQCLQFIYTGCLDKRYHDLQVRWIGRNYPKRKKRYIRECEKNSLVHFSLKKKKKTDVRVFWENGIEKCHFPDVKV